MIKKLLSVFAVVASVQSFAQITVTSADMPNSGDSIVISTANLAGVTVLPGDTAATWDYSTLVPAIQRYDKYDSPTTFTAPFNLVFNPLNTSYGRDNYQLTSFPIPGFTLTDAYDFLKESSSTWKQIGLGYTLNSTPIPFLYSNPDIIYRFPMNYGNSDSCDYDYALPFSIPGLGYYAESGHRHNIVDGWGSLTTPFGTFNTLRITSVIDAVDTVYLDALGFGSNIPRPRRYEYKWLANGMKIPVLQIDATDVMGTPTINNIQFIDSLRSTVPHVGINELTQNSMELNAYPNPANDHITIKLNKEHTATVQLNNLLGEEVGSYALQNSSMLTIPTGQLPAGVYFITVKDKQVCFTRKIVINH